MCCYFPLWFRKNCVVQNRIKLCSDKQILYETCIYKEKYKESLYDERSMQTRKILFIMKHRFNKETNFDEVSRHVSWLFISVHNKPRPVIQYLLYDMLYRLVEREPGPCFTKPSINNNCHTSTINLLTANQMHGFQ